ILLLIRNPKDLATSFYHYSNDVSTVPSYDTWNDFFVAFMTKKSTVPNQCKSKYPLIFWGKLLYTHSSFQNPVLGVKNIAAFFGISLTEEELQGVVERSSFDSMKKNSQKTHGAFGSVLFRKG
ncbi:ST6B1 Sulfotransferase, partial [Pterocles burchelli]|nr:ST6B1 Sulfotransferase [Pterocles burchelli]